MGSQILTNGFSEHHAVPTSGSTLLPNGPLPWVVMKFGGTSVGKFVSNISQIIQSSTQKHRVAIVCSARSSHTKAEGTTNRLLRAAKDASNGQCQQYTALVDAIRIEHHDAAKTYIESQELLDQLAVDTDIECQKVLRVLEAAQTLGEVSPRSVDKIISTGEKLSCLFMTALLRDRQLDAQYVDLANAIDFDPGANLEQAFYERLAVALGQQVQNCGSKVPVITGFFGQVPGGLLDKIGRGYTDLCAALIAVGLKAIELQVWKEVDGIFTADPRKVPTARLLPTITPAEAAELTFYGSEVIHPFTMEQVIRARIPIRIKNVMNPRGKGTVIFPDDPAFEAKSPGHDPSLFRPRSMSNPPVHKRPKRPTAVTVKHKILIINVHSNKRTISHGFFANIFSTLDKWRLSIDLISSSEVHVSMALHSESDLLNGNEDNGYLIVDQDLRGAIQDLQNYGTVDIIPEMCILSLVGKQMKNMVGIAGKMFSTLGENNVNIEMISQGASEINISCVIEERDADRAISILHHHLFTFLDV